MSDAPAASPDREEAARDSANWARPVGRLNVQTVPDGALGLNMHGRHVQGPMQGFGPLWRKTYRVRLEGASIGARELIGVWKARFPEFQPRENRFFPSLVGIKPGELIFIDAHLPIWPGVLGGMPVSAGVMVLYSDDESFTVMTPAGLPEAGWNTFSAHPDEDGVTVAQVQSMARTSDPIFELGFRMVGGARQQEKIWAHVLTSLAAHFGVEATVKTELECLDRSLQWSRAGNVWHNAIVRTVLYKLAAPGRWLLRLLNPKRAKSAAPASPSEPGPSNV